MRVFLCKYSGFSLAIPMEYISSVCLFNGTVKDKIEYDTDNRNTYISLPLFLNSGNTITRHGLTLKHRDKTDNNEDSDTDKIILLTTEIERETEIPDSDFYPVPTAINSFVFSLFFNGIYINSKTDFDTKESRLVLLLNPEQLVQNINKELLL